MQYKIGDRVQSLVDNLEYEIKKGDVFTVCDIAGRSYVVVRTKQNPPLLYTAHVDSVCPVSDTDTSFTATLQSGITQNDVKAILTLPTDSSERKNYPILSGCVKYFPAALAGVARISKIGNDKHNPGQPLHHARSKSTDHGDCIVRHLIDAEDLLAAYRRGDTSATKEMILTEVNQLAWRALSYSQVLQEEFGAPLAPGAKL